MWQTPQATSRTSTSPALRLGEIDLLDDERLTELLEHCGPDPHGAKPRIRRSAEQRLADVAAGPRARRDREERAAGVLDVLVERVVRPEPLAGARRTAARVALEADEEEAGVELAERARRCRR